MPNLKTTPETRASNVNTNTNANLTASYPSKQSLKNLLWSMKTAIKGMLSKVKHCKVITLCVTLSGEYMISTLRSKLTPDNQNPIKHWHYSYTVKVDKDTAKKRTFLSIVTTQLLDGICNAIDRITWYIGLTALSV